MSKEPNEKKTPIVSFAFLGLSSEEKTLVRDLVNKNISNKMSSYLDRIYSHMSDAEVRIKIVVSKNKREKGGFDGSFVLSYSGLKEPMVYIREDFRILADLVNHAFDHFKLIFSQV